MRKTEAISPYQRALTVATLAAQQAGKLLRLEFQRSGGPRGHDSHAFMDAEAEVLIRDLLTHHFPDYGIRGEECPHLDRHSQDPQQHVWLVDPNDGTGAFLNGYRGSAISIALLRSGIPILGVVYAFVAPTDQGDLFAWAEGCGSPIRNGRKVQRGWASHLESTHTVLVSPAADHHSHANADCVAPARFRTIPGIAYRLALVAAGEGEAAVSLNGPQDWDYAAGHALLRGAGGDLWDAQGQLITYTSSGHSHCQGFCFGGALPIIEELRTRPWSTVFAQIPLETTPYPLREPSTDQIFVASDPGVLSRAQGCLLGQLAGDALGSLVEFQSWSQIRQQFPQGVTVMEDGGTWNTLAGQPTDDSELALILARSLLQQGTFSPCAVADAYVYWFRSRPFDMGGTTSQAFLALSRAMAVDGDPIHTIQQWGNQDSQSNGALMRVSPLGILGHALPEQVVSQWARLDASLSHPHPICQDASALLTIAIRRAIVTGADSHSLYASLVSWAGANDLHPEVQNWLAAAHDHAPADYTSHMGWVRIACQNAFYQLLHASSLEEGLVNTVMQGGDTDTNAAIAGALLGAVYGYEGIPFQWRDRILTCRPLSTLKTVHQPRPRPFWPVDGLVLAEHLLVAGSKLSH